MTPLQKKINEIDFTDPRIQHYPGWAICSAMEILWEYQGEDVDAYSKRTRRAVEHIIQRMPGILLDDFVSPGKEGSPSAVPRLCPTCQYHYLAIGDPKNCPQCSDGMDSPPHEFEPGGAIGAPVDDCKHCGLPDRHPIHDLTNPE